MNREVSEHHPGFGPVVGWQPLYTRPPKNPASGIRIAAGIVAICTGLWAMGAATAAAGVGTFYLSMFVMEFGAALAIFILGIVQVCLSRSRRSGLPTSLLILCGIGALASVIMVAGDYLTILYSISMLLYCAVITLSALALFLPAKKHH